MLIAAQALKKNDFNARKEKKRAYHGGMVGIGRRCGGEKQHRQVDRGVHQTELFAIHNVDSGSRNAVFNAALPGACRKMATFVKRWYPSLLRQFRQKEKMLGVTISDVMGGKGGVCSSGAISIDLNNSEHWDCNDGSPGCSVWVADEGPDASADNWYFLLPSAHVDGDERPIAIKLSHGTFISWDGRIGAVRHCSAKPRTGSSVDEMVAGKRLYGCFWCPTWK